MQRGGSLRRSSTRKRNYSSGEFVALAKRRCYFQRSLSDWNAVSGFVLQLRERMLSMNYSRDLMKLSRPFMFKGFMGEAGRMREWGKSSLRQAIRYFTPTQPMI